MLSLRHEKLLPPIRLAGRRLSGLLLAAAITLAAIRAGDLPAVAGLGLGALTLAILAGMVLGNIITPAWLHQCDPGVQFARQRLLRLGIILYGFRLTFQQIGAVGATGVVIDVLMLSSTFLLACRLGCRGLGLDRQTAMLIGAGSSICGAAAVLATAPVLKADADKTAVAVATVVLFGTAALFLYPALFALNAHYHWLSVSATAFGIYTGSTLHEVAQVVAAGHAVGPEAENAAVISKMIRVMLLAPFLLLLSAWLRRRTPGAHGPAGAPLAFPWFALGFIAVAGVNSLPLLPPRLIAAITTLDTWLLAMAMAALGLTTHIGALKRAGLRPLLLALALFLWLMAGGALVNAAVQRLLS
ncbi:YeiH family protein [Sodalis sp. RH22]|uniref:YeiH family protein n=1 Tax=unclassified Sodalis (in: enterobacteria) TaxID=2636512 RepID=UPI0039B6874B